LDVDAKLIYLANTQSARGISAFEKSLGTALFKAMSFGDAIKSAQRAGQQADTLAQADHSSMSALASGGDATEQFSNTSPVFQKTLSALLAKGTPLIDATHKADIAANRFGAAARTDVGKPIAGLSNGDFSMLENMSIEGSLGKVLGATLAKGVPITEALGRAMNADAAEKKVNAIDVKSQVTGFAGGKGEIPLGSPEFDRALATAINRGNTPTQAIVLARQSVEKMPRDVVQTVIASLATGRNVDGLLSSPGNSRVYAVALGNSLAKGMPVTQALALAKRAESANALRIPLSGQSARLAGTKNIKLKITLANGKPLPIWLRYAPETKSFLASDVPEGAFPVSVIIRAGGQQAQMTISEVTEKNNQRDIPQ
jgi:hypothetical protein